MNAVDDKRSSMAKYDLRAGRATVGWCLEVRRDGRVCALLAGHSETTPVVHAFSIRGSKAS